MSASLVEMVMAITLASLIFTGAMVPTTQTVVNFQQAEADSLDTNTQYLATQRVSQLAQSIWRDTDPPDNHAPISTASDKRLTVGDWSVREKQGQVWLRGDSGKGAPLTSPITDFDFEYYVGDGKWVRKVNPADSRDILAVRASWKNDNRPYRMLFAPPDAWLANRTLALPAPEESKTTYRRSSRTTVVELEVEAWK